MHVYRIGATNDFLYWDNGSRLNVIYGIDLVRKVEG